MSVIDPPPQQAPPKVNATAPTFWRSLLKTVYLLWFNDRSRSFQKTITGTTSSSTGVAVSVAHELSDVPFNGLFAVVGGVSGAGYSVEIDAVNVSVTVSDPALVNQPFSVCVMYGK